VAQANLRRAAVAYGQYFRVGRKGGTRTWPVSGGALLDVAIDTPRAIAFERAGKEMVGYQGPVATQIVVLTNPPQSFASSRLESATEKRASTGTIKPKSFSARAERPRLTL